MFRVLDILTPAGDRRVPADRGQRPFVDGRITNPHNKAKMNEQLHDTARLSAQRQAAFSQRLCEATEFPEFAFPANIAPPLITRYKPGMHYGAHADAAYLAAAAWNGPQRPQLHHLPQRPEGL